MATRQEIIDIIEATPANQPIMLSGIHGIGKSESLKDHFEAKGYRVIILFVGQMADAGDLIGLPNRTEVEIEINGKKVTQTITEFCPPKWWPLDPTEKVIIFFDEVNRGKPEIMQCLMDMVNSRKLNGLELPPETRIVGAVNPIDDGYYQVEDLDPAFLDRWNRYDFLPSLSEWTDWASENGVEKSVINFLNKNNDHLDPPSSKEVGSDDVLGSRRSWKKVSDFIKRNPNIDEFLLRNYLLGCIGPRSTSKFASFLKDFNCGLDAVTVLTKWSSKIEKMVGEYNIQDLVAFNKELIYWFDENAADWKQSTQLGIIITTNLKNYFECVSEEVEAHLIKEMGSKTREGIKWPEALMMIDSSIADRMLNIKTGDSEIEAFE